MFQSRPRTIFARRVLGLLFSFARLCLAFFRKTCRATAHPMNDRMPRNGAVFARAYAALAYVCGLILIFGAAGVADTHAAGAFIAILLPGVLFAMLSPFIWSGSRSAMILAFAVSAVFETHRSGRAFPMSLPPSCPASSRPSGSCQASRPARREAVYSGDRAPSSDGNVAGIAIASRCSGGPRGRRAEHGAKALPRSPTRASGLWRPSAQISYDDVRACWLREPGGASVDAISATPELSTPGLYFRC